MLMKFEKYCTAAVGFVAYDAPEHGPVERQVVSDGVFHSN